MGWSYAPGNENFCSLEKNSENTSNKTDITFILYSRVYEILNILDNKSYYGESSCLVDRLSNHTKDLETGKHECKELQKDYSRIKNRQAFWFIILKSGPEWEEKQKRIDFEKKLIHENSHRCYNIVSLLPEVESVRKVYPVMYYGERFDSIPEASKKLKISKSHFQRLLRDPCKPEIYVLKDQVQEYVRRTLWFHRNHKVPCSGSP